MAKKIDITEKLEFGEDPIMVIKGEEITVHSDAETVLKLMGLLGDEEKTASPKSIVSMFELIFSDEDRGKLNRLGLNFKDLTKVVSEAMSLITGDDNGGEQRPVL